MVGEDGNSEYKLQCSVGDRECLMGDQQAPREIE